ncbi:sterile alpha motif domain-containing protein 9-like [Melanotaenia boesemani]|uniref:sterile alpha motif domain-containing protein 9-like n=1 Tax=Melanotaenia boesemani TaxID=1250792 RepID=UPI001C03EC3E|nr:sterile alpha motif domain-containing protein 9-like [Melanotaenia boesemani]
METNFEEHEGFLDDDEADILFENCEQLISEYVQNNILSNNTKLFSILALLNAYVPDSYLCMEECQRILGPPDPIDGGPPFEERMAPFINLLSPSPEQVCLIHQVIAKRSVELLAGLGMSRSVMVMKCMECLCRGINSESCVIQFIKDLLTKREMGENWKEKFSRLITDILVEEHFYQAVQVLSLASFKFRQMHIFPQTVARLCYVGRYPPDYKKAEQWAKKAIRRAQNNSYVADTLGQLYKNLLRKTRQQRNFVEMARKAFRAFKDVEEKAENEEGPEMNEIAGTVNISSFFNNRGLFGFIQVAKTVTDKLGKTGATTYFPHLGEEVKKKFEFFEWYLCYSKPDMTTVEPDYFWKDVALCYECYTERTAADSTSFAGLLDCLNHSLFTSKEKRAGFNETEKTKSTLETVRDLLKAAYEENADDVKMAERYILSNIILNNKMPNSPQHSLVRELQTIIHCFLHSEVSHQSPEFYLLLLLLFWPEEQLQVQQKDEEELKQETSEDDELQDRTWDDEDVDENNDTERESAEVSPDHTFDPDPQQYVTFMEGAFERRGYAKYFRGRYLLPLFFLGKDSGLSRWIHKSRLDAIVERKVDAELVNVQNKTQKKKKRINDLWFSGKVWHVPEIKDILFPVSVEPCKPSATDKDEEMFVCAGGKKIKARTASEADGPSQSPMLFYLAFNIRGPVIFKVGASGEDSDC